MTRIPVHTVDSAPEGSRDTLKKLEAQFGETELDLPAAPAL